MTDIEIIIKILFSAFLGGAIGFFREIEGKPAGLRTHILVSIGSTLLMIVSIFIGVTFAGADASRIAAAVVTGIGFIGAGAIITQTGEIRGITTAASVWVCSAIGLAVGAGLYSAGAIATLISLFVIVVLRYFEKRFIKKE